MLFITFYTFSDMPLSCPFNSIQDYNNIIFTMKEIPASYFYSFIIITIIIIIISCDGNMDKAINVIFCQNFEHILGNCQKCYLFYFFFICLLLIFYFHLFISLNAFRKKIFYISTYRCSYFDPTRRELNYWLKYQRGYCSAILKDFIG